MNILIITPHFPAFDIFRERSEDPSTKFLYDYAVEWKKMGNNILVLHALPKYPSFFPWVVRLVEAVSPGNKLQLKRYIQNQATLKYSDYVDNGIHIIRIPVSKYIPHRDYFSSHIRKLAQRANFELQRIDFQPDMILSDFLSPSLAVACHVKGLFEKPVFQIFHQTDFRYIKANRKVMLGLLGNASCLLFRSYPMKRQFERMGIHLRHYDYMFSGVPSGTKIGSRRRMVRKFLYAGAIRYSKKVHRVIQAFAAAPLDDQCRLEIVGGGPDEQALKQLPVNLGIAERVTFLGRVPRKKVFERMRRADCLVMVSKETFGMVYIEAMFQGCIVIAAKGQGIDGIVVDGENGFLVPVNDMNALTEIMHRLSCMDENEVARLSRNAIDTAAQMKDDVLAYHLLERLKTYAMDEN